MLNIKCDKCNQELTEPGGLIFSPPKDNNVKKYHVCKDCYAEIFGDDIALMTYVDNYQKKLEGYNHIIDDGEVESHGYFIPKQKIDKTNDSGLGVEIADVPVSQLCEILDSLSEEQTKRLENEKIH